MENFCARRGREIRFHLLWLTAAGFLLNSLLTAQPRDRATILQSMISAVRVARIEEEPPAGPKCGTHVLAQGCTGWGELTPQARAAFLLAGERPVRETSRLSPSGHFRIHYDTAGYHQPAMLDAAGNRIPGSHEQYIDSVAAVFDYCWEIEVEFLGYRAPASDGMIGGGLEYDIYVEELGSGMFGATWFDVEDIRDQGSLGRDTTYTTIDNDFRGLRTAGMDGLRVTAAHEFYHAIQIGGYGLWNTVPHSDLYFYELSSVWMEDVAYDDINDYLFDLPRFFRTFRDAQKRSYSMTRYDESFYPGYERAIFAHFLAARFGPDFLRKIWEGIRSRPFLETLDMLLQEYDSDLGGELLRFQSWNFFTADRADTARFYPEGRLYPRFLPNMSLVHSGMATVLTQQAYPVSTQMIEFAVGSDTVNALVVNADAAGARKDQGVPSSYAMTLSGSAGEGAVQNLANGLSMTLEPPDGAVWRVLYLNALTGLDVGRKESPSPNPLRIDVHEQLILPVTGTDAGEAEVLILSASLDQVYSGILSPVESLGKRFVAVPVRNLRSNVSTGVHFVVMTIGGTELRWKVMIVR